MIFVIPSDCAVKGLGDLEIGFYGGSYQPAEPDVGIMRGYYEEFFIEEPAKLSEYIKEFICDNYNDELQEIADNQETY